MHQAVGLQVKEDVEEDKIRKGITPNHKLYGRRSQVSETVIVLTAGRPESSVSSY